MDSFFHHFTASLARFIGRPLMMIICLLLAIGSVAAYASHDDLLINGTNLAINVLTLLFLPILQATQYRDGAALQAKLDELIKVNREARDDLIGIEDLDERGNRGTKAGRVIGHRSASARGGWLKLGIHPILLAVRCH